MSDKAKEIGSKAKDATVAGAKKTWKVTKTGFFKSKRYLMRKMGRLHESATTEEYNQLHDEFSATKDHYKQATKTLKKFCKDSASTSLSAEAFADLISHYGAGQDSALGQSMCKFSETIKSLSALQESFHGSIAEKTVAPMMNFLDVNIKEAKKINKLYLDHKTKMDEANDKVNSLQKKQVPDPVKIKQAEKKLEDQTDIAQGAYRDVMEHFDLVLQQKDFEYLEQLLHMMDSYYNFFADGYAYLHELKPYMDGLRTELDNARAAADADDVAAGVEEVNME